ncbi:MAG: hypothetical protein QXT28_08945 [Thermofilaceae archaeon]
MAEEVIFSVEGNEKIPVIFRGNFPVVNSKATHGTLVYYTELRVITSEKGVKYVVARKKERRWGWKGFDGKINFAEALPRGAIILFHYRTGTHSNAYHTYSAVFVVDSGGGVVTLADSTRRVPGGDVTVEAKNLRVIKEIAEEERARIEALFANKYGAKPSLYDPVALLYYYWVEEGLAQPKTTSTPPPPPAAAAPAEGEPGELRPPELELELELPAVTGTTAVVQPAAPAAPAATAPPTPPAPARGLEEEARDLLHRLLREQGYVTATIIAFDLPSEYRGSSSSWEEEEEGRYREVRTLSRSAAEVARLRTLRKKFYALLNAYAFRSPVGWILMDPAGAVELRAAAETIVKEAGGQLHWLELPLPRAWLVSQAEGARARLAASEEEVAKQLADAALSAALRKRLARRKEEIETALKRLSAFLESLR